MIDFTSALYLGWRHAEIERSLDLSEPLTLGKPALLEEPPGSVALAAQLADLTGFEACVTAPSTLHLALDVAAFLADRGAEFFADREIYPISRWGLDVASARGARVRWFQHHNPQSLRAALRRAEGRPVVIADGFCPACGKVAPLGDYLMLAKKHNGQLFVDDTQAFGILGRRRETGNPMSIYGSGGGGSFAFLGLNGKDAIVMNSLSKAFGAPVACLLGSRENIGKFTEHSKTRVHCSPPSTAVIRAGLRAVEMNRNKGDRLRRRLCRLVAFFRKLLIDRGWNLCGSAFPVQAIEHPQANRIQDHLLNCGVRTLLQRGPKGSTSRVSFVLNAEHQWNEIAYLANALDMFDTKGECRESRIAV